MGTIRITSNCGQKNEVSIGKEGDPEFKKEAVVLNSPKLKNPQSWNEGKIVEEIDVVSQGGDFFIKVKICK